ncbi:hypothetical protein O3M35_011171 [Rhynocoris fuscipes]|uniref:U11/U12 small nuclear ribonucleoprotein 35 kDa protein n=1 Tax=Rhynocoris fuscipes TaxID=488301 RepID=A0AAW1CU51_9HEMI
MPRRRNSDEELDDEEDRPQRNAANARERARMRVLSRAFCRLKTTLPWVPPDTKLSKLDTLRLATSYIAHLRRVLQGPAAESPSTNPLNLREDCEKVINEHVAIIRRLWCPRAIVYDPLKAGSIDGTDSQPHDRAVVRAQNADYKPNRKVKGDPDCTVFIARLNPKTSEKHLKEIFSRFGDIRRCRVVEDIITGRSRGYAFIEFTSAYDAMKAYRRANKMIIHDSEIFVDMECERLLPGWIPRRLGGGFSGKKESGQLRFGGRERPFRKPIKLLSKKELIISLAERLNKPKEEILKETSLLASKLSKK